METMEKHMKQVEEGMSLIDLGEVEKMVQALAITRNLGGTVYVFGNGGSHATASHFANDLMKMCKIRAICLGDSIPITSAYGNDDGWENMFSLQLQRLLQEKDGVFAISCSGNSENVVQALEFVGGYRKALMLGLTGMSNESRINHLGLDALVHTRVPDIRVQEDLHMIICHGLVRSLQERE